MKLRPSKKGRKDFEKKITEDQIQRMKGKIGFEFLRKMGAELRNPPKPEASALLRDKMRRE
jgi:hypothetical protein